MTKAEQNHKQQLQHQLDTQEKKLQNKWQAHHQAQAQDREALAKKQVQVEQQLRQEQKRRYSATLDDMARSCATLEAIQKQDLDNARIFDVDLRHERLPSIIKGRLFEQCMARYLTQVVGMRMKNWSPDKGFLSGVYVEANNDPDLLLAAENGDLFAVECKYRKNFIPIIKLGNRSGADWASTEQVDHYRNYGGRTNIPVYVAIGVGGSPMSPEDIFFAPLNSLYHSDKTTIIPWKSGDSHASLKTLLRQWKVDISQHNDSKLIFNHSPAIGVEFDI